MLGMEDKAFVHNFSIIFIRFYAFKLPEKVGPVGKIVPGGDIIQPVPEAVECRYNRGNLGNLVQSLTTVAGRGMFNFVIDVP